jgi:hypothetical protein
MRPGRVLWAAAGASAAPDRALAGRKPMLAAIAVIALGSLAIGALGTPIARLVDAPDLPTSALSIALSLVAVALGAALVVRRVTVPDGAVLAARRQLYANDVLERVVQRPVLAAARIADVVERRGVDAAVDGFGRAARSLAHASDWIERHGIDAGVDGLARGIGRAGASLRTVQSGRLYEYLRGATLGAAAVAVVIALTTLT